MKKIYLIIIIISIFSSTYSQGWNNTITTTITPSSFQSADNFANKDGIHVLTIGNLNDNPTNNVRYNLLNSSGTIVRSYTFESGGSFPCITGDNNNVYAAYWKNQTIKEKYRCRQYMV